MKTVGIDPAGPGFSGMALCQNGEILKTKAWIPKKKIASPKQIKSFYGWMIWQLNLWKPDIVAVEKLQVFQSKTVVRVLAQREGVALLAGAKKCNIVVEMNITSGRAIVLGNGGLSKDDAWTVIKKQYPDHDFGPKTRGGLDCADAAVLALGVEDFLERER